MNHPNKIPFHGVLTMLDEPSDKPPNGARGHRVLLTERAAREALPTLEGMGINFSDGERHNVHGKQGIIESASIVEHELRVTGYMFGRDCPDVVKQIHAASEEWGMSYELADAHVPDMRAEVWELNRVTFTGAAIIRREKAAYRKTSFVLGEERCSNA